MEEFVMKLRVKPYRGRHIPRSAAFKINDMLLSAPKPNRAALKKEAREYEEYLRKRVANGEKF